MIELVESAPYEGLLDLIDAPPPPKDDERIKAPKDYPFSVKVHINERADCDKFADLLGCDLSSEQTEITFNKNAKRKAGATYTENRADPLKRSTTHKTRDESILWGTTTDFRNDPIPPYQSFEIVLTDATQHIAFLRLLKQQLSFETTYTYFPKVEKTVSKGKFWVSKFEDHQPRYPIFIVSKGRAYSRVTAMALQRMGVPFRIIIEPQDWDDYEAFCFEDATDCSCRECFFDKRVRVRRRFFRLSISHIVLE